MKILVVNGPNLNMLGVREPDLYGSKTLADLEQHIWQYCQDKDIAVSFFQSNSEGAIIDAIQNAYQQMDGIIINPAAYTHTSVAILDALKAVALPTVEVHISDINAREDFRKHSYITDASISTITGLGFDGYLRAVDILKENI